MNRLEYYAKLTVHGYNLNPNSTMKDGGTSPSFTLYLKQCYDMLDVVGFSWRDFANACTQIYNPLSGVSYS